MTQQVQPEGLARRRYPRRRFRRELSVLSKGHYEIMTAYDIGEGGICFVTNKPQVIGARIVVNVALPSGLFLSVRCLIRNQRKSPEGPLLIGCEFQDLSFESKRGIRAFVTARLTLEH